MPHILPMSVGTAANWGANLLVALTFLTLTKLIGKPATFWLYGIVTLAAWFFAFFLVPETKGKTSSRLKRTCDRENIRALYEAATLKPMIICPLWSML